MAQYNETIYASDSWAENYANGELSGITRAASLTSQENFAFTYDNMPYFLYAASESWIRVRYPTTSQYQKKRLVRAQQYVYVTGTSSSSSGSLKSGRFVFGYGDYIGELFEVEVEDSQLPELGDLEKNQYARIGDLNHGNGELSTGVSKGYLEMRPNVWAGCTGSLYTGNRYTAKASMSIQSHTGENRPYVVLTYEDVEPEVDHCAPKSGFVNEKADNVFRWRFWANQTAVAQPVQQAAYQFRWRVTGQSAYQESTVASGEGSHTVPAGTFPENGSIDWCVRGQSDDGVWSDWSDWMTLTTQDSLSKPSGLRPDLGYVDGNLPQPFSWEHVISTGTPQSAYELQYKTAEGEWLELTDGENADTQVEIPQDTLPSGKLFWRVRTANSDGVWGDWSEPASIVVRARPPAPAISGIDPAPRILVCWQAEDQQGYQVRIGEREFAQQYGTEKEWRCPAYLEDGSYLVSVRIQNVFGLWSQWASVQVTIRNRGKGNIYLTSRVIGRETLLSWNAVGDFTGFLIKRDGKAIAETGETTFFDRLCCAKHQYEIIGQEETGHYVSSGIQTEIFSMSGAAVSGWKNGKWIPLQVRREGAPVHRMESTVQAAYQHYYGFRLPRAEIAQAMSRQHQFEFSLPDNRHLPALQALMGQVVIYKDQWNCCLVGVLDEMTVEIQKSSDVAFRITEISWEDEDADEARQGFFSSL